MATTTTQVLPSKKKFTTGDFSAMESLATRESVNLEKGEIYNVKICGFVSKNKARYTKECLESAVRDGIYEGAMVNINHPERDKPGADRRLEDRIGRVTGIYLRGDGSDPVNDGVYARVFKLLKNHERYAVTMEAAEEMPETLGFSHNAITEQEELPDGTILHKSIKRLRSVDLVANPATTKSIFESENNMAEACATTTKKTAMEDDPMNPTGTEMGGGEGSSDPLSTVMTAFGQQVMDIFHGEEDDASKISKFKALVKKSSKIRDLLADDDEGGEEEEEPVEESEEKEEAKKEEPGETKESVDENKLLKAQIRLLEAGIQKPTKTQIKHLANALESEAEANELVESWKPKAPAKEATKQPKEKPKTGTVLESAKQEEEKGKKQEYVAPAMADLLTRGY